MYCADGLSFPNPTELTVTVRCARFCRSPSVLLTLCVALQSDGSRLLAAAAPELEQIITTWRNRQAQVQTAEIVWEQNREGMNRWSNYQSVWAPCEGYERTCPGHVLKLSYGRVRYETDRWYHRIDFEYSGYYTSTSLEFTAGRSDPFYRLHMQEPVNVTYERARQGAFSDTNEQQRDPWRLTSVCDGKTSTDVFEKPSRDVKAHSEVIIRKVGADRPLSFSRVMEDMFFRPILLLYRPFDPALGGCRPEHWELLPEARQVDGSECEVIREPAKEGWETRYFVDPHREFVVLRMVMQRNQVTRAQFDAKYGNDLKLAHWTTVLFSDQQDFPGQSELPCYASADVTRCSLNAPLDESEFQIPAFPTNSLIVDQRTREVSILRADGSKRVVTREEMSLSDADFAQVAATSTGNAPQRDLELLTQKSFFAVTGGSFALAIALAVRRRLRKNSTTSPVAVSADASSPTQNLSSSAL